MHASLYTFGAGPVPTLLVSTICNVYNILEFMSLIHNLSDEAGARRVRGGRCAQITRLSHLIF